MSSETAPPSEEKDPVVVRSAQWIIALVSHVAEKVGMVLLSAMVLVVSFTCYTRYVHDFTAPWAEEVALLCMVWFGFMAIALGVRDEGHIGVTILDPLYPPFLLRILNVWKYAAIGAFSLFMIIYGYQMALGGRWNKFPGLGITSYWLYIIVPVSGVAILVYCMLHIYRHIRHPDEALRNGGEA